MSCASAKSATKFPKPLPSETAHPWLCMPLSTAAAAKERASRAAEEAVLLRLACARNASEARSARFAAIQEST
jgi:hypothetical protein